MSRRLKLAAVLAAAVLLIGVGAVAALVIAGGGSGNQNTAASGTAKGYLGVTVAAVPVQGLRVASVEANGPAAKAGIQVGDFIQSVDGQVVRTPDQLKNATEAKAPGSQVSITYIRADQELRANVKLAEEPANAQIEATPAPGTQSAPFARGIGPGGVGRGQLGVQVQNITPELKKQYNLTKDAGIVVTNVQAGSIADKAGLKAGDVIEKVNGNDVTSAEDVARAIIGSAGQQVSVVVLRGSKEITLTAQMTAASLFPGFENLPPQVQQRLEQLAQSSNLSPQQLQRFAQGQSNLRVGTVKSISSTSLTITPLEGGNDVTYTLNATTSYRSGATQISQSDLATGNTVLVISLDGQTALGVFRYSQ